MENKTDSSLENKKGNYLSKQFTAVTPLSKYLAIILFILMPFAGFWFGINKQQTCQVVINEILECENENIKTNVSEDKIDPYPSSYNKLYFGWSSSSVRFNGNYISFEVPAGWDVTGSYNEEDDSISFGLYFESEPTESVLNRADIVMEFIEKDRNTNLESFFNDFSDGWFTHYEEITTDQLNGLESILADDSKDAIGHVPTQALFVELDDRSVMIVSAHLDHRQNFSWEDFMSTVDITAP